ncbi:MAG: ribbon-helix-helix protein, CopG family [Chloroflexi bacterium]|nr:ribbon-helix-helix protein, CopG family [Chloroflexota bacterium]
MRTIIDLPQAQLDALAQLCAREGISRAEAIRRAVDSLLASRVKEIQESAFGIWTHDRRDAEEILDELRADWDRP